MSRADTSAAGGWLLAPLGACHGQLMRLRRHAYARGWLRRRRLRRPVVSVGNLSLGGTGKTPLVVAVVRELQRLGCRPGVLSRGYGRRSSGVVVVADRGGLRVGPDQGGDEPVLLAHQLPGVPVVVAERRWKAGALAESQLGVDVHVLDDGFQHLSLERDLDLVAIDATRSPAGSRVLPAGRLRERPHTLARADLLVLTRTHLAPDRAQLEAWLEQVAPGVPREPVLQRLSGWRRLGGELLPLASPPLGRVLLLSSIGNPRAFASDVERLGVEIAGRIELRDHHRYTTADWHRVAAELRRLEADAVLTTRKDLVRLEPLLEPQAPVWALELELELASDGRLGDLLARLAARAAR